MFNSAAEYIAAMGVGINSDACKTKPSRRAVQANPSYYKAFYDKGFRHIRLRVVNDITYDQFDTSGVLVGGKQLLDEVEIAVINSLSVGLLPVVAYGGGLLEEDPTPENEERFFQWWKMASDHLKNYDNRVALNLAIEVGNPLQQYPDILNRVYARVIEYVRLTQPTRVIFCAPVMLSEPRKLKFLVLPENDAFISAEIHDYASGPVKDPTHAKYWNESDPSAAIREGNRQRFRDTLDVAVVWRSQKNIPLWFGAILPAPYNKDGGTFTPDEQAVFVAFVIQECKARGIAIAFNSDDKYIDMSTMLWKPDQGVVLKAILA
jgi:Cellulase (glycosyl hydrolase family 5)